MNQIVSVNEHKVVFLFFKEREFMEEAVTWSFVFLFNLEINLWEVFCAEFIYLLLSKNNLHLKIQNWNVFQLSFNVLAMMLWEQWKMLLHFIFAFNQLLEVSNRIL